MNISAYYCFLIARNYRQVSVYSRAFYTYMTIICLGSTGKIDNLIELKDELITLLHKHGQKVVERKLFFSIRHNIFYTSSNCRTTL